VAAQPVAAKDGIRYGGNSNVFGTKRDYILVGKKPSSQFCNTFEAFGIGIPEFILIKEALRNTDFLKIPKRKLKPWGWSPAAHQLLFATETGLFR
jgi:hypothetical protein